MQSEQCAVWLTLALVGSIASGCTAISDLGRFKESNDAGAAGNAGSSGNDKDAATAADGGVGDGGKDGAMDGAIDGGADAGPQVGCDNPATLCLRLMNFDKYKAHLVVIDLVTADRKLRARAALDPPRDAKTQDIVMPLAVPADEVPEPSTEHPLNLEIWADTNDDRQYSVLDDSFTAGLSDRSHAEIDANATKVPLITEPTPIGGNFQMKLRGFNIHVNRVLEVMLIESSSRRTVGFFRLAKVPMVDLAPPNDSFTIGVPGVVESGKTYEIEFYADAAPNPDGNQKYDGVAGGDHSWIIRDLEPSGADLLLDRTHSAPSGSTDPSFKFVDLTYQFPFED